jgi:phosphoenolpyruvate---glycerone phosphotransferase subunit DhaL
MNQSTREKRAASLRIKEDMSISQKDIVEWINLCGQVINQNRDYLIQLDAAIGDADHGANMDRGFKAVLNKIPELTDKDIGTIFKTVGMTLISTVGGAGGPLYGTFFLQAGMNTAGKMELSLDDWINAFEAAVNGVIMRGKAEQGDKTMLDSLIPALNALKLAAEKNQSLGDALQQAAQAAKEGMEATTPLEARKGRASYLGPRSIGHQDPGATSSYLLLQAAADTWDQHSEKNDV